MSEATKTPTENPKPETQPEAPNITATPAPPTVEQAPPVEELLDIATIDIAEDKDDAVFEHLEDFDKALEHFGEEGADDFLTEQDLERVRLEEAKWIQKAIKRPGGLHRALGVPQGEPIPLSRIRGAAKKKGRLGRMARLALTLRKLRGRRESVPVAEAKQPSVAEMVAGAIRDGFNILKTELYSKTVVETPPKIEQPKVEVKVEEKKVEEKALPDEKKEESPPKVEKIEEAGKGVVELGITEETVERDYKDAIVEFIKRNPYNPQGSMKKIRMDKGRVFEADEYKRTDAGSALPDIWSSEVVDLLPLHAVMDKAVQHYPHIKGKPGDTLHIPTINVITYAAGSEYTEATAGTPTTSSVPFVVAERIAEVKFDKSVAEDAVPGLIPAINDKLAQGYEWDFDGQVLGWMNSPATAIGGTLTDTGFMKGTLIAKLAGSFRSGTCEPKWLVIHPVQEASLLQDTQFTNAATYGNREVIQSGRVWEYLGLNIIVSPRVSSTGGTYRSYMFADNTLGCADKRTFEVETYYHPPTRLRYFVATGRYGGTILRPGALWECKTVNG